MSFTPATYTVKLGDSSGRVARDLGVTIAAPQAANPQITDWGQVKIGQQLNIPAGGPTDADARTDGRAARTFPPLPAVAVIATGKFTGEQGGLIARSTGTTIQLRFRFEVARWPARVHDPCGRHPGRSCQGVKCLTWVNDEVVFTGTFDPLTRQLDGTLQAIETSTVTRTACKGDAGVVRTDSTWHAQVSADGKSHSGSARSQGTQEQPFVASIKIGG
jgi:LysM repeat protein